MSEKDYRVVVRVKNNRILAAIEAAGFVSLKPFCDAHGLSYTQMCGLVTMREPAFSQRHGWRATVLRLSEALKVLPEDLFNERQVHADHQATEFEFKADEGDFIALTRSAPSLLPSPEDSILGREAAKALNDAMLKLSAREERVLRMRFGIDCEEMTLAQCGEKMGRSGDRIRVIEANALRKLKRTMRLQNRP